MNSTIINIDFAKEKHEYYGNTGVQLYAVKSEKIDGETSILIDQNTKAIDLYKLYHDIVIFLSNQVEPFPDENNRKAYPVFGNPKHTKFIKNKKGKNNDYQIVGFLNKEDIEEVGKFFNTNSLEKKENVQQYFESLKEEVKEELHILLADRVVWELHGYLEPMVHFFNECIKSESEVVIIANP